MNKIDAITETILLANSELESDLRVAVLMPLLAIRRTISEGFSAELVTAQERFAGLFAFIEPEELRQRITLICAFVDETTCFPDELIDRAEVSKMLSDEIYGNEAEANETL